MITKLNFEKPRGETKAYGHLRSKINLQNMYDNRNYTKHQNVRGGCREI